MLEYVCIRNDIFHLGYLIFNSIYAYGIIWYEIFSWETHGCKLITYISSKHQRVFNEALQSCLKPLTPILYCFNNFRRFIPTPLPRDVLLRYAPQLQFWWEVYLLSHLSTGNIFVLLTSLAWPANVWISGWKLVSLWFEQRRLVYLNC